MVGLHLDLGSWIFLGLVIIRLNQIRSNWVISNQKAHEWRNSLLHLLCSENCISWICGLFFENAHKWKPLHRSQGPGILESLCTVWHQKLFQIWLKLFKLFFHPSVFWNHSFGGEFPILQLGTTCTSDSAMNEKGLKDSKVNSNLVLNKDLSNKWTLLIESNYVSTQKTTNFFWCRVKIQIL